MSCSVGYWLLLLLLLLLLLVDVTAINSSLDFLAKVELLWTRVAKRRIRCRCSRSILKSHLPKMMISALEVLLLLLLFWLLCFFVVSYSFLVELLWRKRLLSELLLKTQCRCRELGYLWSRQRCVCIWGGDYSVLVWTKWVISIRVPIIISIHCCSNWWKRRNYSSASSRYECWLHSSTVGIRRGRSIR